MILLQTQNEQTDKTHQAGEDKQIECKIDLLKKVRRLGTSAKVNVREIVGNI